MFLFWALTTTALSRATIRIHFQIGKISSKLIGLIDSGYNNYYTNGAKYFNMNHWGNYNYGGWAGCDLRYDVLGSTDVPPFWLRFYCNYIQSWL